MQNKDSTSIPIVILAGGQSQRLRLGNKYKWQLPFLGKKPLLDYIIEKAHKQSKQLLLNAPYIGSVDTSTPETNDESHNVTEALGSYGLPLIHDVVPDFQGPLAGLLTSLHWAKEQQYPWIATIACDTPFFPDNLIEQLLNSRKDNMSASAIMVASGGRLHPVFGLWSTTLYKGLQTQMTTPGSRSVVRWAQAHNAVILDVHSPLDKRHNIEPFFNINTEADYQQALCLAESLQLHSTTP